MMLRLAHASRLVLASHNRGKLREIAALVAPYAIEMVSAADLGLPEPEETEADCAGNARLKASVAARAAGLPALADDSGFCVAALGGAPGVLSARWAGPGKDFTTAMARVRRESAGSEDNRAWFVCVLSLAWPDGAAASFMGRIDGTLAWPPRGDAGFGYDPIFVPRGDTRTYGEMPAEQKHADSHRARAMAQLAAACLPSLPAAGGGAGRTSTG